MWDKLKHSALTSGRALAAYWLMTAYGLLVLSGVILVVSPGSETLMILAQIAGATVVGQLLGNVLGALRPRLWLALALIGLSCWVQVLIAPLALNPLTAVAYFILPFTLLSGFLAVRNQTEIFGAWVPMMYAIAGAVVWMNSHGKVGEWETGSKWAVWDALTFIMISGALLLFIIYLVARQSQAMGLWQEATAVTSGGAAPRHKPHARVSWTTWGCVGVIAVVLSLTTAAASPFLFRTVQDKDGGRGQGSEDDGGSKGGKGGGNAGKGGGKAGKGGSKGGGKGGGKGSNKGGRKGSNKGGGKGSNKSGGKGSNKSGGKGSNKSGGKGSKGGGKGSKGGKGDRQSQNDREQGKRDPLDPPDPDWKQVEEGVKKTADQSLDILTLLVILLLVALSVYFIFWRPVRRLATLRHLERPAWPVAPTRRIQDQWRRLLVAIEDIGIVPRPTETPEDLADRGIHELTTRFSTEPTGLRTAAAIYSRVQYNIGLRPDDNTDMSAAVELVSGYVEDHLSWWQQVQNLYSGRTS